MSRHVGGFGRRNRGDESVDYLNDVLERFRRDALRRRREVRDEVDTINQAVSVDAVEFYCRDNARAHHTQEFDLLEGKDPSPVLRRGEYFFLGIRLGRPLEHRRDLIKLHFMFGPKQQVGKGTLIILPVTSNKVLDRKEWDVCISRQERNVITLQIQIPPTARVGLWRLDIYTSVRGSNAPSKIFHCKESIYILFNPWCKDDQVYLADNLQRQEYVFSDVGKIYVGTHKNPVGRPWVFGQFSDAVLPASVFLLEKSGLDSSARGNPVKVVRAISAMVNSNDEGGVLVGSWSGSYEDGTAPWAWTGSAAILEEYLASGGKPVRYGQCWVFSGVCTTVCRALGIPCRSVTNYVSAHDTDDSLTVDKYFDADGNELPERNTDSIWNFHVWNDCWMARPDLPSGYGGWQAIDATPQETSEGAFRAGPASVVAIRKGEISHTYDTPFVFAEVNADIVHWQQDDDSDFGWKKLRTNTSHVGRLIVTKRAGFDDDTGSRDMEDISQDYKMKEGTLEERMSVLVAGRRIGGGGAGAGSTEDVRFQLRDISRVALGRPFRITVAVESLAAQPRTVTAVLSASAVHYTGVLGRKVKRVRGSFALKPYQKEELGIEVSVDDYLDKLVDYAMLKIYAIATVKETQQTWADEDDFQVEKPNLKIEVIGVIKVYRRFQLQVSFTNPLKKALEECAITIEGPGLTEPHKTFLRDVEPESTMVHVETLAPRKAGPKKITAIFTSRQLIEVLGTKQVIVED